MKHERFLAHIYFLNVTVSQTTVSTEPMKMFRLKHETMRVCQTNVVRFVSYCVGLSKFEDIFQVFSTLGLNMDGLKVNRFGRRYRTGVALDQDMRTLIIDRILEF